MAKKTVWAVGGLVLAVGAVAFLGYHDYPAGQYGAGTLVEAKRVHSGVNSTATNTPATTGPSAAQAAGAGNAAAAADAAKAAAASDAASAATGNKVMDAVGRANNAMRANNAVNAADAANAASGNRGMNAVSHANNAMHANSAMYGAVNNANSN